MNVETPDVTVPQPSPSTYPELSVEQRLSVRDLQIELVIAKEEGIAELKATEEKVNARIKAAEQKVLSLVQAIGTELKIEGANFNLGTLKFY